MNTDTFKDIIYIVLGILGVIGFVSGIAGSLRKTNKRQDEKMLGIQDRVVNLENCQKEVKEDLTKIKDNHLVHIQNDITDLKVSVARIETKLDSK